MTESAAKGKENRTSKTSLKNKYCMTSNKLIRYISLNLISCTLLCFIHTQSAKPCCVSLFWAISVWFPEANDQMIKCANSHLCNNLNITGALSR